MASTYVNDLRLNEMATGDASGTWGTNTNVNLELIGEALGYGTEGITTNADTHTSTIADGATDPVRAMYVEYTGTLDSACTITIAPNTINRMQFIENGTSGSQNIIISQGSGANITIPPGDVKAVYLDGAGSGAAVVDAFASLNVVDLKVQDDLTVTDDVIIGGDIDLEGSIDVNGTANLDIVDIDGAVNIAAAVTMASTNKILFNDASQFIQGSSATVLSIAATDEIDLTATAIDVNGTLDVSGQATFADGSAGAPSISNTGDVNAGLFFSAADVMSFSAGGTAQFTMADGSISPVTDNDIDLGTASLKYKSFFAGLVDAENFKINGGQGSDGQVLTSTGSGVAFEDASGGAVSAVANGANNRIATFSSSDALNGEANLTFTGTAFTAQSTGALATVFGSEQNTANALTLSTTGGVNAGIFLAEPTADHSFGFQTSGTERMRIASDGKTMINATAAVVNCMLTVRGNFNNERGLGIQSTTAGGDLVMFYATAQVGTITSSSGGVTYGSASDYRLKENVDYDWNATTRLKQLKPARFNFISDDTNTLIDGFIAHEVSSIVPTAVNGDKDATETFSNAVVSADSQIYQEGVTEAEWIAGKAATPAKYESDTTWASSHTQPKMQMLDPAKIVPLLVKTVQELEARIAVLEG